jgi:hypothetical protein
MDTDPYPALIFSDFHVARKFFAYYLPKVNSHKFSKIIKVTKNCGIQGFYNLFV